jgi:alkane 1-monooxygenase
MTAPARLLFFASFPLLVAWGLWSAPATVWFVTLGVQGAIALLECLPALRTSPPPAAAATAWDRAIPRLHGVLQLGLLAFGVALCATGQPSVGLVVLAGLAVGWVTGTLGITLAHELGHSRSAIDRAAAWLLMGSVLYAHFMVEHYRGHHVRAATHDDPASARLGESLWRFLPRTLAGGWRSAWALEATRLGRLQRPWLTSPLAWATFAQLALLLALAATFGWRAVLFWVVQAAYAVLLLETVNYIEHYGLQRKQEGEGGRFEPFGAGHAWGADHRICNFLLVNLQRHADHHMHPWKPYPTLQVQDGPRLPASYAGSVFLAWCSPLWFRAMRTRLPEAGRSGPG